MSTRPCFGGCKTGMEALVTRSSRLDRLERDRQSLYQWITSSTLPSCARRAPMPSCRTYEVQFLRRCQDRRQKLTPWSSRRECERDRLHFCQFPSSFPRERCRGQCPAAASRGKRLRPPRQKVDVGRPSRKDRRGSQEGPSQARRVEANRVPERAASPSLLRAVHAAVLRGQSADRNPPRRQKSRAREGGIRRKRAQRRPRACQVAES